MVSKTPWATRWWGSSYSDDLAQSLEDIALGAGVEQLLELARRQHACRRLAGIAGVAGSFEGEVASCGEGPVSEVGRMHGSQQPADVHGQGRFARLHAGQEETAAAAAATGTGTVDAHIPVSSKLEIRLIDSMAAGYAPNALRSAAEQAPVARRAPSASRTATAMRSRARQRRGGQIFEGGGLCQACMNG
jgi:hypothetical protein